MKKVLLACLLLYSRAIFSQDPTEPFKIGLPIEKISRSLYDSILFIDARENPDNMGFVQIGAFNKKANVIFKIPPQEQLSAVIRALTDSTKGNAELIFQLRRLSFAELTKSFSEKGFSYIRIGLYEKVNDRYFRIGQLDTLVTVKAMDVTKQLLRETGNTIVNFVDSNLQRRAADSVSFSFEEIANPDSVEKSKLKVYTSVTYNDGLYSNYSSFSNQVPDKQVLVDLKGDEIRSVKIKDSTGNFVKIKPTKLYALVYKGQPYIATEHGYYHITKMNDNLYFTGKLRVASDQSTVLGATLMFGILGGLLASNYTGLFFMKIDHNNGSFIPVREIIQNPNPLN